MLNFIGKVVNQKNLPIKDAKVSLEGLGIPLVNHTDGEGVFRFAINIISGNNINVNIRVEAEGYKPYNRFSELSIDNKNLEEIRLIKNDIDNPIQPPVAINVATIGAIATVAAALIAGVAMFLSNSKVKPPTPPPTPQPSTVSINSSPVKIKPNPEPSSLTSTKRKSGFAEVDVRLLEGKKVKFAGSTVLAVLLCSPNSSGDTGIHHQIKLAHPNLQLEYILPDNGKPPNSGEGIKMLINDQVDFVISSRTPTPREEGQIRSKNSELEKIKVAKYPIAIVVNSNVDISSNRGLTLEQLRRIFAGNIRWWNDVGGSDQVITPYVHIAEKGALFTFLRNVMVERNDQVGNNTLYVSSTTEGLQKVAKNPGGIYRVPAPLSFNQLPQSLQTIPIVNKNNETALPYKEDPNFKFKPLNNCKDLNNNNLLNTENITSAPINTKYPEELIEPMYVIFKNTNLSGRSYAELLLTAQGQKMLEHIGFLGIPQ
ncbi:PstS family phosphate ABC transporter substrate-binding protein [Nostoc sp.]|uniref:PstS family phosphate ABC transporter substrate-binding protein n=1 Tax=Nostoc sp. TaxID=1180 RepID=UPI002FFC1A93